MRSTILLIICGTAALAQAPGSQQGVMVPPRQVIAPLISISIDEPSVKAAIDYVRKNLAFLSIQSTVSADQIPVSGSTLVLRCNVTGEDGHETWEFTVSKTKAGALRLKSARLLEN